MTPLYILISICSLVLYSFSAYTDPTGSYRSADGVFLIAPYFALLMSAYAVAYFGGGSKRGLALLWLSFGIFSYAAGESVWFYLQHVQQVAPSPSFADILFLLVYPCFLVGMYIEFKLSKARLNLRSLLQKPLFYALLVAVALVGYFGIYGAYAADNTTLENAIAISYGVGDLLLAGSIGVLLMVLSEYDGGKIHLPWRAIALGFVLTLIGDLGLAFAGLDTYNSVLHAKMLIDVAWMSGYFLFGYGMLQFALIARNAQDEAKRQLFAMQVATARTTSEAAKEIRRAVRSKTKKKK